MAMTVRKVSAADFRPWLLLSDRDQDFYPDDLPSADRPAVHGERRTNATAQCRYGFGAERAGFVEYGNPL